MNSQRLIALGLLVIILMLVGSSSLWTRQSTYNRAALAPSPLPTALQLGMENTGRESTVGAVLPVTVTIDPNLAELLADAGMSPPAPSDQPIVILAGSFTAIDEFHGAVGTAQVYRMGNHGYALRLDPFEIVNGPDLHVILSEHPEPRTSADSLLPTHIDLGELKAQSGAQNYEMPEGLNITRYRSVVIYSIAMNLVYSSAPLTSMQG